MSSKKLNPFKDFQSDQIQRSSRKIFNAHYACRNAALNLTPVTGTTNGFIFQIINSLIESWGYAWPVLCKFHAPALWSGRTQHKNVIFLHLDTVLSDPENFANIWQIEGNWIRSMKKQCEFTFWMTFSVCCHPEILLPWQRNVTTSPFYTISSWLFWMSLYAPVIQ